MKYTFNRSGHTQAGIWKKNENKLVKNPQKIQQKKYESKALYILLNQ